MPANYNYDMIVSQSPPSIFSHSPPAGFLTDYMSTYRRPFEPPGFSRHHHHHNHHHNHHSHHHQPFSHHHQQPQPGNVQPRMLKSLQLKMASATIPTPKSCLAKHDHSHHADASDVDETDHVVNGCVSEGIRHSAMVGGKAKRVVFADDKGLELTHVKIMSEPSNVPPYWTLQFLAEVTHGLISPVAITEQWEVDFKQPASDYLGFRQVLEERKVSLENVIVRESESIVVGTVKVRNLSFNKEVIVRVTYDKWKSQEDIQCTYSNLGGPPVAGAYALYDTFAFKLTLPPASKRSVEFCVCFRCDGQDYWDNNNGQNYTLSKRVNGTTNDSILTNAPSSNPASKLTIIQDLKGSWNTGTLSAAAEDQHQPYW